MPVQFKFRGERAFRSLLNVTTPCTLHRVKNAIYEQARISDAETELTLEDSAAGGALEPKALLVQDALVQVVVRRTPIVQGAGGAGGGGNAAGGAPAAASAAGAGGPSGGGGSVGSLCAAELRDEEDLAIDRVVDQHELGGICEGSSSSSGAMLRYSRSYRLAIGSNARQQAGYDALDADDLAIEDIKEPPPANYTCHRCGMMGGREESHWIWDCPTNDDPDYVKKVRTAKGIPREFLRKVATVEEGQEQSAGGVTFTLPGHTGHYIYSHESTYEDKKRRVGDTVQEKVVTAFTAGATRVEESLKCPLCHQIFRQAILAPCCGATFCSDCVVDRIAHSSVDDSRCPGCGREVYAHQLVANEDIRKQVEQVSRATKANALATQKAAEPPKMFELDASLKDRVNRPRKHAMGAPDEDADRPAGGAPLAIADAAQEGVSGAVAALWLPLGFGPMLTAEHFAEWQRAARGPASGGGALPPGAKERFEDWQRRMREVVAPPLPPPSRESFEEWQRSLREGGGRWPGGPLPPAAAPGPPPPPLGLGGGNAWAPPPAAGAVAHGALQAVENRSDRKRSRREKKDKRE